MHQRLLHHAEKTIISNQWVMNINLRAENVAAKAVTVYVMAPMPLDCPIENWHRLLKLLSLTFLLSHSSELGIGDVYSSYNSH